MRKLSVLIASTVIGLTGLAALMPFVIGCWVKYSYMQLISFYNSQGQFHIEISRYQRNWHDAHASLTVTLKDMAKPLTFTIDQKIQYGPMIVPSQGSAGRKHIGLAAIHSDIHLSADLMNVIQPENLNAPILVMDDTVALSGKYRTHFQSEGVKILFGDDKQLFMGPFSGDMAIRPTTHIIKGTMRFSGFNISSPSLTFAIPDVIFNFSQHQSASGLWLGSSIADIKSVTVQDTGGKTFTFTKLQTSDSISETNGLLNGKKNLSISQLNFDQVLVGPLDMEMSVHGLSAPAVVNLVSSYKQTYSSTDLHFGPKLLSLFPTLFGPKASLNLDKLQVRTLDGDIWVNASSSWPAWHTTTPQSVKEVLAAAKADAFMRISMPLARELLGLAADINYIIHRLANPEQAFLEAQKDQDTLEKQTALLVAVLIQDNQLPKAIGMQLVADVRTHKTYEEFSATLVQLLADHKITAPVKKMLDSQYQKIKVAGMSPDERLQYIEDQFAAKFNAWIKNGFITQKDKNYLISVSYQNDIVKMNGKEV